MVYRGMHQNNEAERLFQIILTVSHTRPQPADQLITLCSPIHNVWKVIRKIKGKGFCNKYQTYNFRLLVNYRSYNIRFC